jgi:tRNA pseudouridine55 synthase
MRRDKEYRARVVLGATSQTLDAEGPIVEVGAAREPAREEIETVLAAMIGEVEQRPPAFSAVHVDGERAWRAARQGRAVEPPPRRVRIDVLRIERYAWPELELRVGCGKGTYVRSIARDLGEALGCGGYLGDLRRTRACGIGIERAVELDRIALGDLVPLGVALEAEYRVDLPTALHLPLRQGKVIPLDLPETVPEPVFAWIEGQPVAWIRPTEGGWRSRALLEPRGDSD